MLYFLFMLGSLAQGKIAYLNKTICTKCSQGYLYIDAQMESGGNYMVTTQMDSSGNEYMSYEPLGLPKKQYAYQMNNGYYPELRVPPAKLYNNGSILTFDEKNIYLHSQFNSSLIQKLNVGTLKSVETVSDVCFGNSLKQIFALICLSQSYQMYIYNNSITTYNIRQTGVASNLEKDRMVCQNGHIFINFQTQLLIFAMNSSLTLLYNYTYPSSSTFTMELKATNQLFAYSYGNSALVYNYTTSPPTLISTISLNFGPIGLDLVSPSYIVISSSYHMIQFDYEINLIISTVNLIVNYNQKVFALGTNLLVVLKDLMISPFSDNYIYYFSVDSIYDCGGCSVCPTNYDMDALGNCVKGSVTNNLANLTNSTTVQINSTNNSNFTSIITNNSISTIDNIGSSQSSSVDSCLYFTNNICTSFCSYKCQKCEGSPDKCSTCSANRIMTSPGNCQLQSAKIIQITTINILSTFRVGGTKSTFFFLQNFEKYQYHKTIYTGAVQNIIDGLNQIDRMKWSLISLDSFIDLLKIPIVNFTLFNAFTNPKFLSVERNSAFLLENIQVYYLFYIPSNILLIFILKQVFHYLSNYKISQILRQYSFWFQLLSVIILSNASRLTFLSVNHLFILFSFSTLIKILHALSLIVIGLVTIVLISYFYLSEYIYKGLSKYFLINVFRIQWTFTYNTLMFSIRPFVEAAIHVCYFQNPQLQLKLISAFQIFFLITSFALQLNAGIFKSKLVYLCDFTISFGFVLINLLLWIKHFRTDVQEEDFLIVLDQSIDNICRSMMVVTVANLTIPFFAFIYSMVSKEKNTDDIWNWGRKQKKEPSRYRYNKYKSEIERRKEQKKRKQADKKDAIQKATTIFLMSVKKQVKTNQTRSIQSGKNEGDDEFDLKTCYFQQSDNNNSSDEVKVTEYPKEIKQIQSQCNKMSKKAMKNGRKLIKFNNKTVAFN